MPSQEDYLDQLLKSMTGDAPAPVAEELPPVEEETPAMSEELPTFEEETPAMLEEMPTFEEETPAMPEEMPTFEEETPVMPEELPTFEEETSAVEGVLEGLEDIPVMEDENPSESGGMDSVLSELDISELEISDALPDDLAALEGLSDSEDNLEEMLKFVEDSALDEEISAPDKDDFPTVDDMDLDALLKSMENEDISAENMEMPTMPVEEETVDELPVAWEEESANELSVALEESGTDETDEMPESVDTVFKSEEEMNNGLSEDEVNQMIMEASDAAEPETDADGAESAPETDDDLMSLLQGTDDSELRDIHDMLQKSDNNEAVDEDLIAMLQGSSQDADLPTDDYQEELGTLLGEGNLAEDDRKKRSLEKKRLREEKAAEKKAAREAAKAAKRAAKEAKGAAKKKQSDELVEDNEPIPVQVADLQETDPNEILGSTEPIDDTGDMGMEELLKNSIDPNDPMAQTMQETDDLVMQNFPDLDSILGGDVFASEDDAGPKTDASDSEEPMELDADDMDKLLGVSEEGDKKTKKKGFFAKILDLLTDEEEEEKGNEDIPLSDENKAVLEELDAEDKKGRKGKKAKKGKKGKDADKGSEGEDDEDLGDEKGGKKAKKKEKKPKKEKQPKQKEPEVAATKISFKKVFPVLLFGATLAGVVILLVNIGGDYTLKKEGKEAFYKEDYETCYQDLYGKRLNESEQVMFGKSESILRIRLWMREYELFEEEGAKVAALDVLIQTVKDYPVLREFAAQWNAEGKVQEVYDRMLEILSVKYGLSEEQARIISAEPDDVEYTRIVTAIAEGTVYGDWNAPKEPVIEQLPDMLPEEQEFQENVVDS